jgi:hypothetical protein
MGLLNGSRPQGWSLSPCWHPPEGQKRSPRPATVARGASDNPGLPKARALGFATKAGVPSDEAVSAMLAVLWQWPVWDVVGTCLPGSMSYN